MNGSLRLELEYLNVQLCQSRSALLAVQSALSQSFREAVYQLSTGLTKFAAQDDDMREAFNLSRRDRMLSKLGYQLGDLLLVSGPGVIPWTFRLENADFRRNLVINRGQVTSQEGEVFRLLGRASIPGHSELRETITHLIETEEDAAQVTVVLRALPGGVPSGLSQQDFRQFRAPIKTFLTGLSDFEIAHWRSTQEDRTNLQMLQAAKSEFCPKGAFWDAIHRRIQGTGDFKAYHAKSAIPFLACVPKLYAEGRRLSRLIERIEERLVDG
jgi:hypothetical protein